MSSKCDGHRPICVNCGMAETRCSFLDSNFPYLAPTFSNNSAHEPASRTVSTSSTSTPIPLPEHSTRTPEPPAPYSVNMIHVELFNNLSSKHFLSIEDEAHPDT